MAAPRGEAAAACPAAAGTDLLGPGARPRVLRSTAVQWATKTATMLVSLAMIAFLTRRLGAGDYGRFALIGTFTTVVGGVLDGGVALVLTRELSRGQPDPRLVGSVLRGRLLLGLAGYAVALAVGVGLYHRDPVLVAGLAVALLGLLPAAVISTAGSVYQVRLRLGTFAGLELAARVAGLGGIVAAVLAGGRVLAVVAAGLAATLVQAVLVVAVLPGGRHGLAGWDRRQFIGLLRVALPLGTAVVLNSIYARLDAVLISLLRPVADVGRYLLAYRVMELVLTFPGMFALAALPVLSRAAGDLPRFTRLVGSSLRFVALLTVPAAVCCLVLARPLVRLLAGAQFDAAADPLRWLSLAVLASGYNIVLGLVIVAFDGQRRALWLNVTGLMLNLALNVALIPRFGISAAAAVTSLSEAYVTVGALLIVRRRQGAWPALGHLPRLLPAALVAAGLALLLRDRPLLAALPATLAGYGATVLLTRQVRRSDLADLLR